MLEGDAIAAAIDIRIAQFFMLNNTALGQELR